MEDSEHLSNIFTEYRPFHSLITAYNLENFHHPNWRCKLQSIYCVFWTTLINLFVPILTIFLTWFLIENGAKFNQIVVALPIVISSLQMELILIALIMRNRIITETIKRIEDLVNQRELAHRIYEQAEKYHVFVTKWLMKIAIGIVSMLYLASALFPILDAIFGYPPQQQWILPLETQ